MFKQYKIGDRVNFIIRDAVSPVWMAGTVTEVGEKFIRVNPDDTSFNIAVSDPGSIVRLIG